MQPKTSAPRRWLSLKDACHLLGVTQATLRHWADQGRVRSFRTPGGHRRFLRENLVSLTTGQPPPPRPAPGPDLGEAALQHIRLRLHARRVAAAPWHQRLNDEQKARLGLFGRRLLEVTLASLQHRRSPQHLAEVRLIGHEYGTVMAQSALSLSEAMEAFLFFRNTLRESVREAVKAGVSPQSELQAWQQIESMNDQLVLALVSAYERSQGDLTVSGHGRQAAGG